MKAIILSAGQGKRLYPLTETTPKCLLSVGPGRTLLGWQMEHLIEAGITDIRVVTGYCAGHVAAEAAQFSSFAHVESIYNEDFDKADNLRSVWTARGEMTENFILINGDTLFTADVVRSLIAAPPADITVTISAKDRYDSDDMKVTLRDGLLQHIGKSIPLDAVDAESIGMIRFCGSGAAVFCRAVDDALKAENGDKVWYLSVIDRLAGSTPVHVARVASSDWCEVDFPVDLQRARMAVDGWLADRFDQAQKIAAQAS